MKEDILLTVLLCAEKTDGQANRRDLIKILAGQPSKKLLKNSFDHLNEYGYLSNIEKKTILEHIDYLVERGCLSVSSLFFPAIYLTELGRNRINKATKPEKTQQKPPVFSYQEYLKSPHWKEIRKRALDRAGHHCFVCRDTKNLNVHHNSYERLGKELDTDLIVLCEKCHNLFYKEGKLSDPE